MKRWHKELIVLGCCALAGLALGLAILKWDIYATTWGAKASADYKVVDGGRMDLDRVTVTNTGTANGGYPGCWVWGFSASGEHVASGFERLPVELRPHQQWVMTVDVTAETGYPAREPAQVTSFTAACYEYY